MDLLGPIFYSKRFNESVEFYKGLGLKLIKLYENEFATFAFADGRRLGIKAAIAPRHIPGSQTMMVKPADIDVLYKHAQENHWNIIHPLTDEEWGRTFIITDPDQNHIEFIV